MNQPSPSNTEGRASAAAGSLENDETCSIAAELGTKPHSGAALLDVSAYSGDPTLRYQIDGEIARGGMGAVFKGRDRNLGREVAVKVLLATHSGRSELVQRFVEEARIAGRLQHPGVAPVYDLGRFRDERPYFAMKLVHGQTLAAMLAERTGPASDRARFVGIFAQVCQTLAYAHAQGVIHRDLKPANVMVGAFGEVQVMDWGLAKVLSDGAAVDAPAIRDQFALGWADMALTVDADTPLAASHTQAGSVLGTPAYMAPEQARGDVKCVDKRSDVFGLGAILCQILTGQPPFVGHSQAVMRLAQAGNLNEAFMRLTSCGADVELVNLAKHCLANDPQQRPADAGGVAEAATAYQDSVTERLRQAELARAAETARTEEARATAEQERKAREAAQARAVAERRARRLTLGLAASVLTLVAVGAAGGLWAQRQAAERRAEAERQRDGVETALEKARGLRQQERWAEARAVLEQTRGTLARGPEDLRQRVDQAVADVALVDRLDAIRMQRALIVAGKLDVKGAGLEYAAAFKDAGLGDEGEDADVVAARIRGSAVREQLVAALDIWAMSTSDPQRAAWLLEVARLADPDEWRDSFHDVEMWCNPVGLEKLASDLLADERRLARQSPQLLEALGTALIRTKVNSLPLLVAAQDRFPDDFWLNFTLADAYDRAGRPGEGAGFYRVSLAIRPSAMVAHYNLGHALRLDNQLDGAAKALHRAIELDSEFAAPHIELGNIYLHRKQLDEAILEFGRAIAIEPRNSLAHSNLGNVLRDKRRLDEAVREFRLAIDLDPNSARPHKGLGTVLCDQRKFEEAMQEHRRAIELDPDDFAPHHGLGRALYEAGQPGQAIQELRKAVALNAKSPLPHIGLGLALNAQQQSAAAILEFRRALELDPANIDAHFNLAESLRLQRQLPEAISEFRRALDLDPKNLPARNGLALALADNNQLDEAVQEIRLAIADNPAEGLPYANLAPFLFRLGNFAEASEFARRGLEKLPANHPAHAFLTRVLHDSEQLLALDQNKLSPILEGREQPVNEEERIALAKLCKIKKLYAAAARFYAAALAAKPELAGDPARTHRYDAACYAALAGCGLGRDADQLDDQERTRLRKQALAWMRDELAWWGKHPLREQPGHRERLQRAMNHWQHDPDLVGLRDEPALAKLPAEEREACRGFWALVAEQKLLTSLP